MRLIVDGMTFENPNKIRIEVAPEGETVGPWTVEVVGGQLTVLGKRDGLGAVHVDRSRSVGGTMEDGCINLPVETPPLHLVEDPEFLADSWRDKPPML